MSEDTDLDDESIEKLSEYLDGGGTASDRDAIAKKIADDPGWRAAHDDIVETRKMLSGMQKARAKPSFAADVTSTINARSAGRFFGRRTFGDRVPFGALVVIAVLGIVAMAYVMWASQIGSLEMRAAHDHGGTHGSAEIVPKP
jgi:anti-sigma factor RsiW